MQEWCLLVRSLHGCLLTAIPSCPKPILDVVAVDAAAFEEQAIGHRGDLSLAGVCARRLRGMAIPSGSFGGVTASTARLRVLIIVTTHLSIELTDAGTAEPPRLSPGQDGSGSEDAPSGCRRCERWPSDP